MSANRTIEQAAEAVLVGWRHSGLASGRLPDDLRPRNLPQAYGIQQAVNRELGPVGGWRICSAEPEARLAAAPLPIAMFQPEPALLAASGHAKLRVRPALTLELGCSLPEYDAPFGEAEIIRAIGSTRPAALVLDPAREPSSNEDRHDDPLIGIAESCGRARVIYGRGVPGLPQAQSIALTVASVSAPRLVGRRQSASAIGPAAIGDLIGSLRWLANFGTGFSGGLMVSPGGLTVGQMVVVALAADAISIAPGAAFEIGFGELGKVTLHTRGVKP